MKEWDWRVSVCAFTLAETALSCDYGLWHFLLEWMRSIGCGCIVHAKDLEPLGELPVAKSAKTWQKDFRKHTWEKSPASQVVMLGCGFFSNYYFSLGIDDTAVAYSKLVLWLNAAPWQRTGWALCNARKVICNSKNPYFRGERMHDFQSALYNLCTAGAR